MLYTDFCKKNQNWVWHHNWTNSWHLSLSISDYYLSPFPADKQRNLNHKYLLNAINLVKNLCNATDIGSDFSKCRFILCRCQWTRPIPIKTRGSSPDFHLLCVNESVFTMNSAPTSMFKTTKANGDIFPPFDRYVKTAAF